MPYGAHRHRTLKLLADPTLKKSVSVVGGSTIDPDPAVIADIAGATDTGRVRDDNQDQFLIASLERALLVERSSLPAQSGTRLTDTPQGRVLAVADGIGGHGGGEVASAVAIDAMAHYAFESMPWVISRRGYSPQDLADGLGEALQRAQGRLRRVAQRKELNRDLGTTLTMAYVAWPHAYVVHVGDSRAYLLRGEALHRITSDHTLAQQLLDHEAITADEPAYSHFSHVLVNAVGGSSDQLQVEFHHCELQRGDRLLLCTDGLYDCVTEPQIAEQMGRSGITSDKIVGKLIELANAGGGSDNITAVLARF